MGAVRARRWKLPFHSPPSKSPSVTSSPARPEAAEVFVPQEFLCPILDALMADPVILPSGRTFERACLTACTELSFCPPGASSPADVVIPNAALRAAIGTWCARSGRVPPAPPSAVVAREAVLRAMPAKAAAGSSSNSSCSSAASAASTSSSVSSSEIIAVEEEDVDAKEVSKEVEPAVDELEEEVVAKVVGADQEGEVEAAMAELRRATRESTARRRALCTPRLVGALRRVLVFPRHATARADATAALANLSVEPANRVPIVRAGAVPPLIEVLRSDSTAPEAREHAAGALFGLALDGANRAAIGVLGAVPPLLSLLTTDTHAPLARRDAGMALYHISLAAVNQSKLARAAGAARALLSVASDAAEPTSIRRLALMVACSVAACAEGQTTLMDADALATLAAILSDDTRDAGLEEWCIAAMYGMSRGSLRFRGLARAAGAHRALRRIAEVGNANSLRKEMAQKALRAMLRECDDDGPTGNNVEYAEDRDNDGGDIMWARSMPFHRRRGEPPEF